MYDLVTAKLHGLVEFIRSATLATAPSFECKGIAQFVRHGHTCPTSVLLVLCLQLAYNRAEG